MVDEIFRAVVPKSPVRVRRIDELSPEQVTQSGDALRLGRALNDELQPSLAIPMLERALELDEGNAEAIAELGATLLDSGERERGLRVMAAFVTKHPRQAEARLAWARGLLREGQLERAGEELRRCMEIRPNWDAPYGPLIRTLCRQGRARDAEDVLRDLQRFSPDPRTRKMLEKMIANAGGPPNSPK